MKAIFFLCVVIFSAIWIFWDFGNFNIWLKNNGASLTFFGAAVALLNYLNSVKIARRNGRRASVELAVEKCSAFGTETIPQLTELRQKFEKAGSKYLERFPIIHSRERLETDKITLTDADKSVLQTERVAIFKALNAVESFAIPFCEGVAATDVGFTECGPAFVNVFEQYFGLFCRADLEWIYPSTQKLYWRWRREIELTESVHAYWRAIRRRDAGYVWDAIKAMLLAAWRLAFERIHRRRRQIMMLPISEQSWKR